MTKKSPKAEEEVFISVHEKVPFDGILMTEKRYRWYNGEIEALSSVQLPPKEIEEYLSEQNKSDYVYFGLAVVLGIVIGASVH